MICLSLSVRIQILKTASFCLSQKKQKNNSILSSSVKWRSQTKWSLTSLPTVKLWDDPVMLIYGQHFQICTCVEYNKVKFCLWIFFFFSDMDDYFYHRLKRRVTPKLCSSKIKDCCHCSFHLMRWVVSYSVLKAKNAYLKVLLDLTL